MPIVPDRQWVDRLRESLPELPAARRRRLGAAWGFSDREVRDVVNAGALELVARTVDAGATPSAARKWWMGELSRAANAAGLELEALPISPRQVAELASLVADGQLTDRLARQVLDGVLGGEGDPADVMASRGLRVMSDDAALVSAVDHAIQTHPSVADSVRAGRVQAIGALVGAVMKATGGQADAARVRSLIAERLGVG
jgi:aspartyl-tRNA(Asn)/glutamyl-tRNA(Gln) amidotransferase subunit B